MEEVKVLNTRKAENIFYVLLFKKIKLMLHCDSSCKPNA